MWSKIKSFFQPHHWGIVDHFVYRCTKCGTLHVHGTNTGALFCKGK